MEQGERKARLVYTGISEIKGKKRYGIFRCDCGNEKWIRIDSVLADRIKSCGCLYRNSFGLDSKSYEKLYGVWRNMLKRCYDNNSDRYYAYGAKGITVCFDWKNDFKNFAKWAVENGWNSSLSIERKNVHLGYSPENCTFITMKEQARNKTSCIYIQHNGEKKCIAEWCEIYGLNDKTIYMRYKRGIREPEKLFYAGDLRELRGVC